MFINLIIEVGDMLNGEVYIFGKSIEVDKFSTLFMESIIFFIFI